MGEGGDLGPDQLDGVGQVWEWTASRFGGYPGFVAHPYREYSEVFFGDGYRVLRGGSWATHPRSPPPTFRNWDLPERRQIFAGLRLARARPMDGEARPSRPSGRGDERSLADDVLDGLTRPFKELAAQALLRRAGAELFDRICELPEYYPTRAERTILHTRGDESSRRDRRRSSRRARFGHGDEDADAAGGAGRRGDAARYVPVDVTEELVRATVGSSRGISGAGGRRCRR